MLLRFIVSKVACAVDLIDHRGASFLLAADGQTVILSHRVSTGCKLVFVIIKYSVIENSCDCKK